MLKKFLEGFLFGAGFTVAAVLVWTVGSWVVVPAYLKSRSTYLPEVEEVQSPPEITAQKRFLGSSGSYFRDFPHDTDRVLSSGPGRIVGTAKADGKPLAGLRLRLALNGSVTSEWVTSGTDGNYEIGVPYGKYRIDGYNLDMDTAHALLPGKIEHPLNSIPSGTFEVASGSPGRGLSLEFVDPIVLDVAKNQFSPDEDIVIRWRPYRGAEDYRIQIFELEDERGYGKSEPIIPWRERPLVKEPSINLADHGVELTPGRFYTIDVEARGDDGRTISQNVRTPPGFDFTVVE